MSEAEHTRWKDDVAAYVLGVLEPGEALELERHLDGCPDCRAELRWLRPAVDLLPGKVDPVQPPAELRAKILEQARSEPGPTSASAASAEGQAVGRRGWLRSWRPAAAVGVVALVLAAVGGYAIRGGDSGGGGTTTVAAAGSSGVTAQVIRQGDTGTLHLANVTAMPENKVLEAWVQRDGDVTPVRGLFVPDRDGRATTTIPDMRGVEAVMVTTEPPGGSDSPTGSPLVTAKIETG
jgi:anti-sigma-K factor RskA